MINNITWCQFNIFKFHGVIMLLFGFVLIFNLDIQSFLFILLRYLLFSHSLKFNMKWWVSCRWSQHTRVLLFGWRRFWNCKRVCHWLQRYFRRLLQILTLREWQKSELIWRVIYWNWLKLYLFRWVHFHWYQINRGWIFGFRDWLKMNTNWRRLFFLRRNRLQFDFCWRFNRNIFFLSWHYLELNLWRWLNLIFWTF